MKKTILLFCFLLLHITFLFSQTAATFLTWMKGDNTINQVGIYGTQGIAGTINKPGARDFSATWKDSNGNLWLFGGYGYDGSNTGYLNDLWKYNTATNNWTWVKGNNTIEQYGVYGTLGVANAANKPGAIYSSVSWTDATGNLWLFGGFGYTSSDFGFLNDLWKYNPVTNNWVWMKGDNAVDRAGVYGVQGSANAANKPGARYGSNTWTDGSGNLWLFGGYGYGSSAQGILNDLWKYNPSTNQWTWIKGDNVVDKPGKYGVQGVSAAINKPGARYVNVSWTDAGGNFWLYGGYGFDGNRAGNLSDLWKYNPAANEWIWMKGDSAVNRPGVYCVQGVAGDTNKPGARYVSVSWTDATGNLWLFGGYGYDNLNEGYLNDLWKYDLVANKWTWVKGDSSINQLGVYGTQGMPSALNKTGSRTSCVSWTGGSGELWLFGGYGYDHSTSGVLNDLWKISSFLSPLPLQLLNLTGVLNNDVAHLQWQTAQELNFSHFAIQRSFDGTNFTVIGNMNGTGNISRSDYSFYDNDLRNQQKQKVFYRLQLIDKDGHFTYSRIIRFDMKALPGQIHIFPNPAVHSLNISFEQKKTGMVSVIITDMNGIIVRKVIQNTEHGKASVSIDISTLPSAGYILSVINETGTLQQKFIKQQ